MARSIGKNKITVSVAVALVFAFFPRATKAQNPDTLDVPQGYETLNLAVQGDTTASGAVKNPNRVYRLQRGGYYLLNGSVKNIKGAPLRIVAAKGSGPMPLLIPTANESGTSANAFTLSGNGTFVGLYVSGINNLGNQADKNMFNVTAKGARIIIDQCFLDHEPQSFVRNNAENQKVYATNSKMRNTITLASTGNGRFFDTRGNILDTLFVQNCTFYMASSDPVRIGDGIIRNFIWDHVTTYQTKSRFQTDKCVNAIITNNLFIDIGFIGDEKPSYEPARTADSLDTDIIRIEALAAPTVAADDQRTYTIRHNNYAWTPGVLAYIKSVDTLRTFVFHNIRTQRFIDVYPNMISEDNISEYPEFTDAPDPALVVAFAKYRRDSNFSDVNNPDPRADRNGIGSLIDKPESFGIETNPFKFDYPKTKKSYTQAEGGFPLGDLNWFPDKLKAWTASKTGIAKQAGTGPVNFIFVQNYPNPFNPVTHIVYRLDKRDKVTLSIFNHLGQKIRILTDGEFKSAGTHVVSWNGRDDSGDLQASGVYFCVLKVGGLTKTHKMLFVK